MAAEKGKVLVFSIYPSLRLCLENEVKELRQRTDGRHFQETVCPQTDAEFSRHRAFVTPEQATKIKNMSEFGYGFQFILATDLKDMLKTPGKKNHAHGFIKEMHRMSVQGDIKPPIDEMDVIEELGTMGPAFVQQPQTAGVK